MTVTPGSQPRIAATRVLDAVLHHGRSLKAELAGAQQELEDPRDRALVEAICLAVLRQPARFDAALAAWMPRPLARRDRELRALLLVGFAQLDPMGLPAHAAVAATVEAARGLGRDHQAGTVNALLRRALREGLPASESHAHWPAWLRTRIEADWPADAAAILDASEQAPPMWLRVNRQQGARDAYRDELAAAGIEGAVVEGLDDALRLDAPVPVAGLPGFAEGRVSVQDGAAQRVIDAMTVRGRMRVLDACAAPGGKAAHLLEREPGIELTALDIDRRRLRHVRATLDRVQLGADATLLAADATDLAAWWDGVPFDAIVLDAPCSATGIIRRQPDVLLHRRESDIDNLVALQGRLLDALWQTVAPGGALVYTTCSILRDENDRQIAGFLARTTDAHAEPLDESFGRAPVRETHGRQRLPGEDGMDGFFYARLRKAPASLGGE
ncbi:16S rRNA (cytosine(967)-C(5))-methyltransferase RsmB [Lysobacter sp. H23M47]|uniref:16S rRNA (cytosine(967)-C(5))-methyltransferase RsmB n=1 Tax=Lysobacter sp. H23M47 TaxID=2781024 RepID=UPI001882ABCF|nr:16S rRNA (cytosine(967)-C(5))-methyltransferase RsmB [Lysobacter sp. H23M47]QOW24740.1 16S rRNA (cytosine(967)-C(5))-methyltransferase RsmB [Lysobacter sp. H23M47]